MVARERDIAHELSGAPTDHTDLLRLEAEHTSPIEGQT
jgi:hypothetical protein